MASITKRPDGVWRARYRDEAGKEHARHFPTKKAGQQWLDEVTTMKVTGIYVDPNAGRLTFERWYKQWCALQVWEPGTLLAAERAATDLPFAKIALNKITTSHVQSWVKSMADRGLATSTIRMRFNYVHMAFRAAVGERIARDPSRLKRKGTMGTGVSLPAAPKSSKLTIPTADQVRAVYNAAPFHFRPFIAVCAFAGLRLGEAAGLQLADVPALDEQPSPFVAGKLHVARQLQGQTQGETTETGPKAGSDRWVPIPDELVEILRQHVKTVGTLGGEGWLFSTDSGAVYNRNSAGHRWREACKAAGVSGYTLHDLRHFYASGLIAAGCDVVTVQKALGHSKPIVTLNTYSHLWPDAADRTRSASAGLAASVLAPADSLRTEAAVSAAH